MVTAYLLAVSGQPLTSFKTLVQIQKANGGKLIQGTDDSKKAAEFVSVIADVIRNKITNIVTNITAFSILSDGSQARKTVLEKELVVVRTSRDGYPVNYMAALQNIDDYGDANATNLKQSVDDACQKKMTLTDETFKNSLVAMTADGVYVNMGMCSGVLVQIQNDGRPYGS